MKHPLDSYDGGSKKSCSDLMNRDRREERGLEVLELIIHIYATLVGPIRASGWLGRLNNFKWPLINDVIQSQRRDLFPPKQKRGHCQGHTNFPEDHEVYAGANNILTANDGDHSRMRRPSL